MNAPATPAARPSFWVVWSEAARPRTLPAAVAPVLVGTALAWRDGHADFRAAALCLGFALLVQIGTNFANDYGDFVKGADQHHTRVGPPRAVAAGWVRPQTMRAATIVTYAAALLLGLGLVAWGGPWLIVIGVISVLCGYAYTGGPYPLGYHGLGDVFVVLFFGFVAVGATYFVQAGGMTADAWLLALPVGLLTNNILLVNNYRDVGTDRAGGKHTLVVRFGRRFARGQYLVSWAVAWVIPAWLAWRDGQGWLLLTVLLMPWVARHYRRLKAGQTPAEMISLLGATGRLLALYAVLLSAGLVLG